MNKTLLFAAALALMGADVSAAPPGWGGYHGGYGHGYYGARPGWGGGYWGPGFGVYYGGAGYWGSPWGWNAGYAYPYAYAYSPLVIENQAVPQVFIQQEPVAAAPAPAQAAPANAFWYYCTQPAGYFPYVQNCTEPWMKVVPQAPSDQPSAPRLAP